MVGGLEGALWECFFGDNCMWLEFHRWFCFNEGRMVKLGKEGVVWLTVVWCIWRLRNDILFKGGCFNLENLVLSIKLLVWK